MQASKRDNEFGTITTLGRKPARHRALREGLEEGLAHGRDRPRGELTLKNLGLSDISFAGALKRPSIDEIENDTVGKLLPILIWGIGCSEFREVKALCQAFGLLSEVSKYVPYMCWLGYQPHLTWKDSARDCPRRRSQPISASIASQMLAQV